MRVAAQIDVSAPREVVWDWITDPTRQLHFLSGVTRWEVSGDLQRGYEQHHTRPALHRCGFPAGTQQQQHHPGEKHDVRFAPVRS